MILKVFCVVLVIAVAAAQKDYETKRAFPRDCDSGYSLTCFKLDVVSFIDKMSENRQYNIVSGLSIVRDARSLNSTKNSEIVADMARSFPMEPEKRLDGFVLAKVTNFLQSLSFSVKLLDSSDVEQARSAFEGRKKKKGGLEAIIAAACLVKSTLMALSLGGLALLAGKALIAALMALMLSAITGLKSLTGGQQSSTTYEIIAKPQYTQTHSHSSSHEDIHAHGGGGGGGGGGGHSGHSGYGSYGRSLNFVLPEHLTKEYDQI